MVTKKILYLSSKVGPPGLPFYKAREHVKKTLYTRAASALASLLLPRRSVDFKNV